MGIVKEIKRTVNVAWSPKQMQSILLAGGTVAQQLDATFSTSAHIEIFSLDLTSSGRELQCVGKIQSKSRFHKLNWSGLGLSDGSHPQGIIIGGSDNGNITFWDAAKILQSDSEGALICQTDTHVGAVRTLDVNPFQSNLLASGASESEIYIWDLNNPTTPMSPGNKLHPLEDITCVAWNRQAQHILGSTSPSGRSVVWDLRKNEPIIQVSDSNSKVHCKALAWHPDIPTQLVIGSEDDRSPVIQLWDLRFATSPTRILERHKRGVLSVSWCQQDADLMLSAAKDNQVLCWNPNSNVQDGEVVYQLPVTNQWIFECLWCPRNPDIICTTSFDGHVTLYSLLGGGSAENRDTSASELPSNIDSNDAFANIASQQKRVTEVEDKPLKTPPKWFRRPCAASFGFGGHLVSFGHDNRCVNINQVVTEPSLLRNSNDFETSIENKLFTDHCNMRIESVQTGRERKIWNFLKATFDNDPRRQYLQLLGYDTEELEKQFAILPESTINTTTDLNVDKLQEKLATLPLEQEEEPQIYDTNTNDTSTTATSLFGSDGTGDSSNIFDNIGESSPSVHQSSLPSQVITDVDVSISTDNDTNGMLTKALLVGNFSAAVNICINTGRMAEALILSVAGGNDLYESTQQRFLKQSDNQITQLISLITNRKWSDLVRNGSLDNWQDILASLVTYATPLEFATLSNDLGKRLEDAGCHDNAVICYICSGNVEKFVECWLVSLGDQMVEPLQLHDLIEKIVLLRHALYKKTGQNLQTATYCTSVLGDKIRSYAGLLAAQGSLKTALSYLELTSSSSEIDSAILHDRLYHSIGQTTTTVPSFPFERVDINAHVPTETCSNGPTAGGHMTGGHATGGHMSGGHMSGGHMSGGHMTGGHMTNSYHKSDNTNVGYNRETGTNQYTGSQYIPGRGNSPSGPFIRPNPQPHPTVPPVVTPHVPMVPTTIPNIPSSMYPHSSTTTQPPSYNTPTYRDIPNNTGSATTWNDPPMLRKKKQQFHAPIAPLTVPVAVPQDPVQPLVPNTTGIPVKPGTPVDNQPPASPVTPIEKMPLPSEHAVIPTVLEGILTQCRPRANNAVMRRKVDEIGRKLDILSDLLRESRLSTDILQGLHYIVQDCQSMNYQSALARLNQMVANSNLSEISSFFPGIKTLLQLAIQMRI